MANLQPLKIPRGDRGDWPALEYLLIDAVEASINEVEAAREGQASLVANLQDRYATKSYVQIAVGNPTPGDILVTDLGLSPSDAAKIGYTLQVSPSGTLQFLNGYKAASGSIAAPGYNFSSNVGSGMGYSESGDVRELFFSISGNRVGYFQYNTVTGAISFTVDGASYDVTLTNTGGIELQYVSAVGSSTFGSATITTLVNTGGTATLGTTSIAKLTSTGTGANATSLSEAAITKLSSTGTGTSATSIAEATVTKLSSTGTGANATSLSEAAITKLSSTGTGANATSLAEAAVTKLSSSGTGANATSLAEAAVTKLSSTGTGASATSLAEAAVTKLSSTGTGANATSLAEAAVTKLSSSGTGTSATSLAELNLTTLNWKYFIFNSTTLYPTTEAQLRTMVEDLKDSFISDSAEVTIQLPAGGITLTSDLDISNLFGTNIMIRGNSALVADKLNLNSYKLIIRGINKVARVYNAYIDAGSASGGILVDKGSLILGTPIHLQGPGTTNNMVEVIKEGLVYVGWGPTATFSVGNCYNVFSLTGGHMQWALRTGYNPAPAILTASGACSNTYIYATKGSTVDLTIPDLRIEVDALKTIEITEGASFYHAGDIQGDPDAINVIYTHGGEVHIDGDVTCEAISCKSIIDSENSDIHITGNVYYRPNMTVSLAGGSGIKLTHNSSLYVEGALGMFMAVGATFNAANRLTYGMEIRDNSEVSIKGNLSVDEIASSACIILAQASELTHNSPAGTFSVRGHSTSNVTYGVYCINGSTFGTITLNTYASYATTGFRADRMSANFFPTGTIFTSVPTNFSPSPIGNAGNQNALSAYNI